MRPRSIHVKICRTWVGPKGRRTHTGPFVFMRPLHYYYCPDKPWLEGPHCEIKDRKTGKPIRQWYTECHADDYLRR